MYHVQKKITTILFYDVKGPSKDGSAMKNLYYFPANNKTLHKLVSRNLFSLSLS